VRRQPSHAVEGLRAGAGMLVDGRANTLPRTLRPFAQKDAASNLGALQRPGVKVGGDPRPRKSRATPAWWWISTSSKPGALMACRLAGVAARAWPGHRRNRSLCSASIAT
jgi:hypothetical protein